jgi:zinc transport system permease protein
MADTAMVMTAIAITMIDDFMIRAAIGGVAIAVAAGPLGCFVIWRRLSYFGAALSHSALLGIALGVVVGLGPGIAMTLVCLALALAFLVLEGRGGMASDAVLGVLAHVGLALGVIAISLLPNVRVNLMAYLFGDILSIDNAQVLQALGLSALVVAVTVVIWRPLLSLTVHPELARVEGVRPLPVRLAFIVILALSVAIGMRLAGVLLVVSLLIIPAAAARRLSRGPEVMALTATAIGILSVLGGLAGSWQWDLPTGPAIVACAALIFLLALARPGHGRGVHDDHEVG